MHPRGVGAGRHLILAPKRQPRGDEAPVLPRDPGGAVAGLAVAAKAGADLPVRRALPRQSLALRRVALGEGRRAPGAVLKACVMAGKVAARVFGQGRGQRLHDPALPRVGRILRERAEQVIGRLPGKLRRGAVAPQPVGAVAAGAVLDHRQRSARRPEGHRRTLGRVGLGKGQFAERLGRHAGQRAHKRRDRPALVLPPRARPAGHAGVFQAVVGQPVDLGQLQRLGFWQVGRLRHHLQHQRVARHARRAMAGGAAGDEMPGAQTQQRGVGHVHVRRRIGERGPVRDGVPHVSVQQVFDRRPVFEPGRDVVGRGKPEPRARDARRSQCRAHAPPCQPDHHGVTLRNTGPSRASAAKR